MKRIIYLLFIFLVGFSINDVQKEFVSLSWQVSSAAEGGNKSGPLLRFDGAGYSGETLSIPVFNKTYSVKHSTQDFRVVVENAVFEEVAGEVYISYLAELKDDIQIKKTLLKSGSLHKLQVNIVPLKKVGEKVFLLKSFEIKRIPVKSSVVASASHNWKSNSVLSSGKWVKIKTSGKGIYKIPYAKLTEWGFSNPSEVNVFGSGGTILSENPGEIAFDDLIQSAIWHGKNNGADCLFFYEPGNVSWSVNGNGFKHTNDHYSNNGFFFLTQAVGSLKTVETLAEISEAATHQVATFNAYQVYENDKYNLLEGGSGKQWFGDKFINGTSNTATFNLANLDASVNVDVRINAAARSSYNSSMAITANENTLGQLSFYKVDTDEPTTIYASERKKDFSVNVSGTQLEVAMSYSALNSNSEAWLDYVEINYKKKLVAGSETLFFRDLSSVGSGNVTEFSVANSTSDMQVFDVTEVNDVKEVPVELTGDNGKIKRPSSELREYVLFNINTTFPEPELVEEVENQDLHSLSTPEFLIVSHANFISSANQLADFHRDYDGMRVEVVDAAKVYNEFSSGKKDASGIRNFIKMFYDRNNRLKYVLLYGDGSYNNKNIGGGASAFIPTFQSANSLNPVASFVTDDYFAILDAGESVSNGAVDIGIGRIPASTAFEAELVVNKILNYYSPEALGDWRNVVCLIGDDEDGNLHMSDSEKLADLINNNYREFVTDKIYLDAFVQEATSGGESYPEVTEAINDRVKEGVLVLNYVGHANERYMADEHVLGISDINSWSNSTTLPIFVTATCEFSRFDTDDKSAGEYVLFNANGGGIGLFSTTRVVFAYANFKLSSNFYNHVFEKDENGEHYRMGDIMRLAKINTTNDTNKRNFSLLADPALKLSYPKHKVVTSSINQQSAGGIADTLGALEQITISGYIADNSGNKLNDFSGEISPTVYDKEVIMKTLGNHENDELNPSPPMEFNVQENIIYKGIASVTNGEFSFSFVIPKDISYSLGQGKIVYYADNGDVDAHGAFENFVIGGAGTLISDNQGPDIQIFMDSQDFESGDETGKNPTLLAFLSDENGINTVGTGIGHDISAVLDDDYSNVMILNNYYRANIDDFTSGTVTFPVRDLSVGKHTLKLKAWDVANNSSEVEIEFIVSGDFIISKVESYPNPVNEYTFFTFEHNQSDATLDAMVEVFDITGKRVYLTKTEIGSSGSLSNPIRWDLNESGTNLSKGIYIYRIIAQNNDGAIASKSGKIIVAD